MFLLHGCFDILHQGHREYIDRAIRIFGEDNLIIGVWEDKRIKERKGLDRPLFNLEWRLEDIRDRFPSVKSIGLSQEEWELGYVNNYSLKEITLVTLKPTNIVTNEQRSKTFTYRCQMNGYEAVYIEGTTYPIHTSSLVQTLVHHQDQSTCLSRKVAACLIRRGDTIAFGSNEGDSNQCPRCLYNLEHGTTGKTHILDRPPCIYPHAEERVLLHSQPGDDLIITHAPCKTCKDLIKKAGIRRVVIFEDQYNINWPSNYRVIK